MPSAGELLRSERTKRNRTLTEIAAQTCINKRYLEAIEVDAITELPGEFFYRSFIRQYARALELDTRTTDRIVASAVPFGGADDVIPALSEVYENAQVGRSSGWTAPTGVAIALLILVLAACSGLYALWQHLQARRDAAEVAMQQQTVQPSQQTPEQQTAEPAPVEPESTGPSPSPAAEQPSQATAVPPVPKSVQAAPEPGKINLDLSATEPSWVSVSSDGKTLFTATLDIAQSRQLVIPGNAKLTTGNAAGLQIRFNGKPVGPIGPRGQVRVVLFTPDSFQIVPANTVPYEP